MVLFSVWLIINKACTLTDNPFLIPIGLEAGMEILEDFYS